MKFIHTSDWHLGHQLYSHDRVAEQQSMLLQMLRIVERERPDAFLISGDIFHVSQPSAAVQRMFAEFLIAIREAHPAMRIIATAGNHDSASRHEVFRSPWSVLGVEMIGGINLEDDEEQIVSIPGKGIVIAIPYASERYIPEGYFSRIISEAEARNADNLPVVVMAHTAVRGADFKGHEKVRKAREKEDYIIGGIDGIDIEDLGSGYDYLALGHIHRSQFIHAATGRHHTARYSGSPLAVSFDEDYPHTVSVVEIDAHGATPRVRLEEITDYKPLVSLPKTGPAEWPATLQALRDFPSSQEAYIRLNVAQPDPLPPDAYHEAMKVADRKKCRFCTINFRRDTGAASVASRPLTVQEFKKEQPIDIARRYVEGLGGEFGDDMTALFEETLSQLDS